jgi:glycine cleavage system aminomethyltransferase T
MIDHNFTPLALPVYADHVLYYVSDVGRTPAVRAWEFNGWQQESISWKTGCYIHAGLSTIPLVAIKGADARKYLQGLVINSLDKFPVGTMKHSVMCNEEGLIAAHGIIERRAETEFYSFANAAIGLQPVTPGYDVETRRLHEYLFQIAGPTSLQVLEKATGESLRDVGFFSFRNTSINGMTTEVARLGMTGGLAYELHGPIEEGPAIHDAVYKAGEEFGIQRLGWRTYLVNHVEGGFPQATWTFVSAGAPVSVKGISGSVDPANMRARYRTPVEVRWHKMARFDHDFIGREALEAEMANPRRTTVTLRWNADDVIDIYAALLRPGEAYKPIDLPYAPWWHPQAHADHVLKGTRDIGVSSGTIYSYSNREVISMGCIDLEETDLGNEVIVRWGDFGGVIKDVRATVARFPYAATPRNSDIDVAALT